MNGSWSARAYLLAGQRRGRGVAAGDEAEQLARIGGLVGLDRRVDDSVGVAILSRGKPCCVRSDPAMALLSLRHAIRRTCTRASPPRRGAGAARSQT